MRSNCRWTCTSTCLNTTKSCAARCFSWCQIYKWKRSLSAWRKCNALHTLLLLLRSFGISQKMSILGGDFNLPLLESFGIKPQVSCCITMFQKNIMIPGGNFVPVGVMLSIAPHIDEDESIVTNLWAMILISMWFLVAHNFGWLCVSLSVQSASERRVTFFAYLLQVCSIP